MPRELDTSRLEKFSPKQPTQSKSVSRKVEPQGSSEASWPSREAPKEGQFTIRAPLTEIERFRRICKEDRRTYADMLCILMDRYEAG